MSITVFENLPRAAPDAGRWYDTYNQSLVGLLSCDWRAVPGVMAMYAAKEIADGTHGPLATPKTPTDAQVTALVQAVIQMRLVAPIPTTHAQMEADAQLVAALAPFAPPP